MFKNFFNFLNPKTNSNRIYSREDIAQMSTDEFSKTRDAIYEQMLMIGIPTKNVLANSSDVVYVQEYTRANGEVVRAHYRSKPNGISMLHKEEYENLDNTNSFLSDNITKLYDNLTEKNNTETPVFKLSATYNDFDSALVKGAIDDVKNNYGYYMPDTQWNEKERDYYKDIERKMKNYNIIKSAGPNFTNSFVKIFTPDAGDLYEFFLNGFKNNNLSGQANPIPKDLNFALKQKYNINIQPGWLGLEFTPNSRLSESLSSSREFKKAIEEKLKDGKDSFDVALEKDLNLYLAIHNARVFDFKVNKGFYEGYLFDNYDFTYLNNAPNFFIEKVHEQNNTAAKIQEDFGMNYYIIVPFKVPIK